jgi:hypothetical protein
MTVTTDLDRYSVIDLTTVGRLSGRPHTIEIWFAYRQSTIYLLSGGAVRSDWVRNLIRTPGGRVRIGGVDLHGVGRVVVVPDDDRLARSAVHDECSARYSGDLTGWRDAALPIAIDLDSSRGA